VAIRKMLVRVTQGIARYGGVLHDYMQGVNIGGEPVEVQPTPLVLKWVASGELEIVSDAPEVEAAPEAADDGGGGSAEVAEWPHGIRQDAISALEAAGLDPMTVRQMSIADLTKIRGIGQKTAESIKGAFEE